jgi:hypothetical protein
MKRTILTSIFTLGILTALFITLNSNSSGPGGNRSGAPGSSGNCGGCHGANQDANATISLVVLDNDVEVERFLPGKTYDLKLTASSSSQKKGFNLSAINSSNAAAGSLTNGSNGTQIYNAGNQQIWSHSTPSTGTWTCKWTAPEDITKVTFYASLVLSNGNGNNSGDFVHNRNWEIFAEPSNSISSHSQSNQAILNNPCYDELLFRNDISLINIWDIQGRLVLNQTQPSKKIDVSNLPVGIYYVRYQNIDQSKGSTSFYKK